MYDLPEPHAHGAESSSGILFLKDISLSSKVGGGAPKPFVVCALFPFFLFFFFLAKSGLDNDDGIGSVVRARESTNVADGSAFVTTAKTATTTHRKEAKLIAISCVRVAAGSAGTSAVGVEDSNVEMGPLYGTTRRCLGVDPNDGGRHKKAKLMFESDVENTLHLPRFSVSKSRLRRGS